MNSKICLTKEVAESKSNCYFCYQLLPTQVAEVAVQNQLLPTLLHPKRQAQQGFVESCSRSSSISI